MRHAGWTQRGYLPHYDAAGVVQHVVFRLADSLPPDEVVALARTHAADRLARAETCLDKNLGSRLLKDARAATLVEASLLHFDQVRYQLLAWCVMPTHVHVLLAQVEGWPLASVVHSWKSFTAHTLNRELDRVGAVWSRDYFDRAMNSERQTNSAIAYIEYNPVAAGLCKSPEDWPWSSASSRRDDAGETPAVQQPSWDADRRRLAGS